MTLAERATELAYRAKQILTNSASSDVDHLILAAFREVRLEALYDALEAQGSSTAHYDKDEEIEAWFQGFRDCHAGIRTLVNAVLETME